MQQPTYMFMDPGLPLVLCSLMFTGLTTTLFVDVWTLHVAYCVDRLFHDPWRDPPFEVCRWSMSLPTRGGHVRPPFRGHIYFHTIRKKVPQTTTVLSRWINFVIIVTMWRWITYKILLLKGRCASVVYHRRWSNNSYISISIRAKL